MPLLNVNVVCLTWSSSFDFFQRSLFDLTFGHQFFISLLNLTFGRNFLTTLLSITLNNYF